jgi:hypothetical protein
MKQSGASPTSMAMAHRNLRSRSAGYFRLMKNSSEELTGLLSGLAQQIRRFWHLTLISEMTNFYDYIRFSPYCA